MASKELLNIIYDILAQNNPSEEERQKVMDALEYVDTGELELVFRNDDGKRWALQFNGWEETTPEATDCEHDNFNEYFEKCDDCGMTLDEMPEDIQEAYAEYLAE